jgi:hypothetical protein
MARGSVTANEALADGMAYVRDAWRDVWGVQMLLTLGVAMLFTALMGRGLDSRGELFCVGAGVTLVALAPLYGALYRIELGGRAEQTLGPFGLQLGMAEARLWGIWIVRGVAVLAAFLAATALSAGVFALLRPLGMIGLGPLGEFRVSFLIATALFLGAGAYCSYVIARLSLASPASIAAERLVLSEVWPGTQPLAVSLTATWIAVRLPSLAMLLIFGLLDLLENGRLTLRPWPLLDAALFGLLAGGVVAFVQSPLAVGALSSFWRHSRPKPPAAFTDLAKAAPPPPPTAKPQHDRPIDASQRLRQVLGHGPEPARY